MYTVVKNGKMVRSDEAKKASKTTFTVINGVVVRITEYRNYDFR